MCLPFVCPIAIFKREAGIVANETITGPLPMYLMSYVFDVLYMYILGFCYLNKRPPSQRSVGRRNHHPNTVFPAHNIQFPCVFSCENDGICATGKTSA